MAMTQRQKAIISILGLAGAAGAGGTVGQDALRSVLSGTCNVRQERLDKALPDGGTEARVTVQAAVNLANQLCDPNATGLLEKVEMKYECPADVPREKCGAERALTEADKAAIAKEKAKPKQ